MKKIIELITVFLSGGFIYGIVEILWRGHTHWSMGLAGGICFAGIYFIRKFCSDIPLWIRCVTGAFVICAVEFATGFIVNLLLEWNIWDYSDRAFNIYGQICPLYAILWFLICFPGNIISHEIESKFFKDQGNGGSQSR